MECINFDDFNRLSKPREEYYIGRWVYLQEVIKMVDEIKPENVLELGPALFTVVKNSDIMRKPEIDMWGIPIDINGTEYLHDATQIPWPVQDSQYEYFIFAVHPERKFSAATAVK